MNYSAYSSAAGNTQRINLQVASLALGLALLLSTVVGSSSRLPTLSGDGAQHVVEFTDASSLPPVQPDRPDKALIAPVPTGEASDDAALRPLRGAPSWVWDLPDADPRKLAAVEDWAVIAANDRQAGMTVAEWSGRIIPENEYWDGLCPRWLQDPHWGGVEPANP
jgi:hypothetical protein